MNPALPEPGIFFGVPRETYEQIRAVNYSTLKHFARSAAHYQWELLHPREPSEKQELGTAGHVGILEPSRFDEQYVKAPQFDRRTKAGKENYAAFQAAAGDKIPLGADDYAAVCGMKESVWSGVQTPIKEMLAAPGQNEATVVWVDADTGLYCKTRIDRIATLGGWTWIVDLKTANNASERDFQRAIYTYRYYLQAAMHVDALIETVGAVHRRYAYIAVENSPPYCAAIYELHENAVERGRAEYKLYLKELAECQKQNHWPGYPTGIQLIDLPPWAKTASDPGEI